MFWPIGPMNKPRGMMSGDGCLPVYFHPHIQRHRPLPQHPQRIDLHLRQLGKIRRQLAQPRQHLDHRLPVRGGQIAEAA